MHVDSLWQSYNLWERVTKYDQIPSGDRGKVK
jgi:hypothetical protein